MVTFVVTEKEMTDVRLYPLQACKLCVPETSCMIISTTKIQFVEQYFQPSEHGLTPIGRKALHLTVILQARVQVLILLTGSERM